MTKPPSPDGALLRVRVHPRARRNELVGWQESALRVRVTAPPADGRANDAVIRLLAEALSVPRSSITLVSGGASRDKRFAVPPHSLTMLRARLAGGPA
jgi:uncharacterized protein